MGAKEDYVVWPMQNHNKKDRRIVQALEALDNSYEPCHPRQYEPIGELS